jgi:hypothetical protein
MGTADSWIFSAHVVVGIMSENKTSLPMLVPGFLCLCTAIVFGPVSDNDQLRQCFHEPISRFPSPGDLRPAHPGIRQKALRREKAHGDEAPLADIRSATPCCCTASRRQRGYQALRDPLRRPPQRHRAPRLRVRARQPPLPLSLRRSRDQLLSPSSRRLRTIPYSSVSSARPLFPFPNTLWGQTFSPRLHSAVRALTCDVRIFCPAE